MQVDKLRWWSIYREPEHELVGKLQLHINYSTSSDDSNLKVRRRSRNLFSKYWVIIEKMLAFVIFGSSSTGNSFLFVHYYLSFRLPFLELLIFVDDMAIKTRD